MPHARGPAAGGAHRHPAQPLPDPQRRGRREHRAAHDQGQRQQAHGVAAGVWGRAGQLLGVRARERDPPRKHGAGPGARGAAPAQAGVAGGRRAVAAPHVQHLRRGPLPEHALRAGGAVGPELHAALHPGPAVVRERAAHRPAVRLHAQRAAARAPAPTLRAHPLPAAPHRGPPRVEVAAVPHRRGRGHVLRVAAVQPGQGPRRPRGPAPRRVRALQPLARLPRPRPPHRPPRARAGGALWPPDAGRKRRVLADARGQAGAGHGARGGRGAKGARHARGQAAAGARPPRRGRGAPADQGGGHALRLRHRGGVQAEQGRPPAPPRGRGPGGPHRHGAVAGEAAGQTHARDARAAPRQPRGGAPGRAAGERAGALPAAGAAGAGGGPVRAGRGGA